MRNVNQRWALLAGPSIFVVVARESSINHRRAMDCGLNKYQSRINRINQSLFTSLAGHPLYNRYLADFGDPIGET